MYIPLMGESGMRLSLHGIASIMPSILFGPVYGALTSGLTDMLGHFISPSGGWIPWLTLTAVAGGFIRGGLWLFLRRSNVKIMRGVLLSAGIFLVGLGAFNMIAFHRDGITRDFFVRTPERAAAWENNRADDLGTHWSIQTYRTAHTNTAGAVYYRVVEHIEITANLEPGSAFSRDGWLAVGRRVLTQRYVLDDYGVPTLRSSVIVRESNVGLKRLPAHRITRMAVERSFGSSDPTHFLRQFMTRSGAGIIGVGSIFFVLLGLEMAVRFVFSRRKADETAPPPHGETPLPHTAALIVAMMIPAILVSSINTYILSRYVYTSWQLLPFVVVWLPRVVQSMATTAVNFFFITFILGLCGRHPSIKGLIR
jgi:hypothetical protein